MEATLNIDLFLSVLLSKRQLTFVIADILCFFFENLIVDQQSYGIPHDLKNYKSSNKRLKITQIKPSEKSGCKTVVHNKLSKFSNVHQFIYSF